MDEDLEMRRNDQTFMPYQHLFGLKWSQVTHSTCGKDGVVQLTINDYKSVEDLQWLKYAHDDFFIAGHFQKCGVHWLFYTFILLST